MNNKIIIACAGAGKTHSIVNESIKLISENASILILTYTQNNQNEIYNKYKELNGYNYNNFRVKGFFTFLLEEIIRPYQKIIFNKRIDNFLFNESDPHKINGRTIKGRSEYFNDKNINPLYYLTKDNSKAHSTYLSKLAVLIIKKTKNAPVKRLEEIYDKIYIDEVQDLIGWDYEILKILSRSKKISLTCVGDFRQTIYQTALTSKKPKLTEEKIAFYKENNFLIDYLCESRRSIYDICEFSDLVHENMGFEKTKSRVIANGILHSGVYLVRESDVRFYIKEYKPVVLMAKTSSGKQYGIENLQRITYGKSKGLGFDHVMIIPTTDYIKFIFGEKNIFDKNKTESPRNKLYVALTRARYSVAIISPNNIPEDCKIKVWKPPLL